MTDDLVKRLRMDIEPSEGDMEAAADRIEQQDKLILMAFGLLWHDKHNEARRLLADALSMEMRGRGIEMSRNYDDKYAPDKIPLPGPIEKAIDALEKASCESQWWSVDEENDTSWVKYRVAAVMLAHWAGGLGGEDAGEK